MAGAAACDGTSAATRAHDVPRRGDRTRRVVEPLPLDELTAAVAGGDLRILLMCLVHLTGDLRWLAPPYRPRRDIRLVPDPAAGLPADVAGEIRSAVVALFRDGTPEPVIDDPGPELMGTMMSACLGEEVPPEYAGMMREDMGFVSRDVGLPVPSDHVGPPHDGPPHDVLVIGAGVSGLALGAQLGRLGVPYTIVERNPEVGGTWYDNRYPGCGVDTPNHAYSFSFGTRHRWTRYFALRDEIQGYLVRCADEFDVRRHVQFETEVTGASWDADRNRWTVELRRTAGTTDTRTAAVLVSALGLLNVPRLPDIDGLDDFAGPIFHAARWPDDLDVTDRRVSVIGTGATAMQVVPAIAGRAASVTIHQRSPQWARPIDGYRDEIPPGSRWLLEHLPFYVEWFRFAMLWRYGDGLLPLLRRDPEWPHPERAMNRVNDRHRQEMTDFILEQLGDRSDLVERCVPDYPPYGKRILLDNGWFATLTRPDVTLDDTPVQRIEAEAVVTTHGHRHPADIVVLATGFHTTELTARLDIRGRGGMQLADVWADDDPTAHLGISVPGFPNLFLMAGPNTGLGHGGSAMFQAECQARYITAMVLRMDGEGIDSVEVRADVHDDYVRRVDAEHAELIWTHRGMTNWYRNAHGRVTAIMPWRLVDYWSMTHDPDLDDYTVSRRPVGVK